MLCVDPACRRIFLAQTLPHVPDPKPDILEARNPKPRCSCKGLQLMDVALSVVKLHSREVLLGSGFTALVCTHKNEYDLIT